MKKNSMASSQQSLVHATAMLGPQTHHIVKGACKRLVHPSETGGRQALSR